MTACLKIFSNSRLLLINICTFSFPEEPIISWDERASDGGKCFSSGVDVSLLTVNVNIKEQNFNVYVDKETSAPDRGISRCDQEEIM